MWFIIGMVTKDSTVLLMKSVKKELPEHETEEEEAKKGKLISYFVSLTGTKSNALPKEYIVIREISEKRGVVLPFFVCFVFD